jgi:GNAT superfamily N-acetyltransferase
MTVMKIRQAVADDLSTVRKIVQSTIARVYSAFYPDDVVRYFLGMQSDDEILKDIESGGVYILDEDGQPIGTGTVRGNEIIRVFVLPEFHHRGFGTMIMRELEGVVSRTSRSVRLDSSLPGYGLYLKLGYRPVGYQMISTPNGQVLCYHVMEKALVGAGNLLGADEGAGARIYDGKLFAFASGTGGSDDTPATEYQFRQDAGVVRAEYSGGGVVCGFLVGTATVGGIIDAAFEHVNLKGTLRTGRVRLIGEIDADGRMVLRSSWVWTNGDCTSGESVLKERKN